MKQMAVVGLCVMFMLGLAPWGAGDKPAANEPAASNSDLAPVVVEVEVPAARSEVWTALTTNEGLNTWMSPTTNVRLEIGGPFEIYFNASAPAGSRGSDGCKVLSYLPDEMFSYSWNAPPKFTFAREHHTWVVIQLTAKGEKSCNVRLTHLGFRERAVEFSDHAGEFAQVRGYFEKAWAMKMGHLKQRFESGPLKFES